MDKIYQTIENGEPRLAAGVQLSAEIRALPDADKVAAGWVLVPEVPKPPDTAATTHAMVVTQTAEGPVMSWTARAKTNDEITREAIAQQIDALNILLGDGGTPGTTTLRGVKATTNAEINANPARYVKAITDILIELLRAERRSSRMTIRQFDSTQ